jgi:predicted enzyme related to lactoylglutathione lyase
MPNYNMNHIHHEAADVKVAADWYIKLFDAKSDEPFEKGGATWQRVYIGDITVTITDRADSGPAVERFLGYDHLGIQSDDFDATLARIEECGVEIWTGPMDGGGFRIIFINGPDNVKIELMEKN